MKRKIRQTFTVVREYETTDSMEEIEGHAAHVSDEAGEFLMGGCADKETITVVTEVKSSKGWKKVEV